MKYCSNCGSADLSYSVPSGDNRERYICSSCFTIHYSNPRIIVGVLATWGEKVLLCRRAIEPRSGLWNLPAGFLENNETAEQGAARETFEEANAKVEITRLHCVYSIPKANQVFLHFHGNMLSPEFSVTPESTEVALFAENEIPWDDIAFNSTEFALRKFFEDRKTVRTHIGSVEDLF